MDPNKTPISSKNIFSLWFREKNDIRRSSDDVIRLAHAADLFASQLSASTCQPSSNLSPSPPTKSCLTDQIPATPHNRIRHNAPCKFLYLCPVNSCFCLLYYLPIEQIVQNIALSTSPCPLSFHSFKKVTSIPHRRLMEELECVCIWLVC